MGKQQPWKSPQEIRGRPTNKVEDRGFLIEVPDTPRSALIKEVSHLALHYFHGDRDRKGRLTVDSPVNRLGVCLLSLCRSSEADLADCELKPLLGLEQAKGLEDVAQLRTLALCWAVCFIQHDRKELAKKEWADLKEALVQTTATDALYYRLLLGPREALYSSEAVREQYARTLESVIRLSTVLLQESSGSQIPQPAYRLLENLKGLASNLEYGHEIVHKMWMRELGRNLGGRSIGTRTKWKKQCASYWHRYVVNPPAIERKGSERDYVTVRARLREAASLLVPEGHALNRKLYHLRYFPATPPN